MTEVREGRFREDLYYRLHVIPLQLPPLRERDDDVLVIAKAFLTDFSAAENKSFESISTEVEKIFMDYDWPGNVRELENVIERAAILAQGGKLRIEFQSRGAASVDDQGDILSISDLKRLERDNLIRCLRRSQGKVSGATGAARLLELAPTTVYSRIKALRVTCSDWDT